MTSMDVYLNFARVTLVVSSCVCIWMAAFLVICWLLHLQPSQIEPVPTSRSELILLVTLAAGVSATVLVLTVTGGFDFTSTKHAPVFGGMSTLYTFISLAFLWTSIVEPRRAFCLRQQELIRHPDEQP
jgi:hypothetical protein